MIKTLVIHELRDHGRIACFGLEIKGPLRDLLVEVELDLISARRVTGSPLTPPREKDIAVYLKDLVAEVIAYSNETGSVEGFKSKQKKYQGKRIEILSTIKVPNEHQNDSSRVPKAIR